MNLFLETERLLLAFAEHRDLDNLVLLRSDPEVMRFIGEGRVQTREEVEEFLNAAIVYQEKYGFGFFSVFEKETGAFVGQAGLFHVAFDENQDELEVAYRFHKKYWGKGYATECARALIHWAFEHLSIEKLFADVHPNNSGSAHVLEKVGMIDIGEVIYRGQKVRGYEIYKSDQKGCAY